MNRTRFAALLGLAVLGILTVGGCSTGSHTASSGGSSAGSPVQLAFVTNNASDYWTIAQAGVNAAKQKLGSGYTVDFIMPSDGTAATQKQQVDNEIAKGVKAIAISPVDPTNQTSWLNQISSQVAVVTQDSDAPKSKRICYVGTDNYTAGLLAGKEILKALPNGGKIMLFVGTRDAQNAHDREMGIRAALKGSKVQILDVRTDNADHALAKSNAADALVANPDLAMEVGLWSYNGPAIVSALQDAHKVGKVKVVCFDQEKGTLAGLKSGAIFASIVQNPYQIGYQGTLMLAQLAKGDKSSVPASGTLYFPAEVLTSANVDPYITQLDKETGEQWGPGQ